MADIIDVNIGDSTLEVFWQDEVELNLDLALMYIKSGQAEIQNYVDNVSKPEITNYVETEAKPLVTQIVEEIAEPTVAEYIETTVKPEIDEYTDSLKPDLEAYATQANASAIASAASAAEAKESENNALSSKNSAATSAQNAANSATVAKEYAQDAATSANLANIENKITNCITKIPQDIKLELNNGTLTLKAGSKVYVPNGVGIFDEVTVESDKSWGQTTYASGNIMLFYRSKYNDLFALNDYACYSGSSAPTAINNMIWYDTANGKIKWTNNKGSTWNDEGLSLPLNNSPYSNGKGFTSIDQVFNGFGYIGSTIFALPGVEGLIPNGRNADGSLNNTKFKTNRVLTFTESSNNNTYTVLLNSTNISNTSICVYDETLNLNKNKITGAVFYECNIGIKIVSGGDGRITSFNPKTAFHAADYNDVPKLAADNTFTGVNTFNKTIYCPTPHTTANGTEIPTTAWVHSFFNLVYPVGSLYFSTAGTCPLQSLGIGTWNKVGTSLTLSVNTNVPVRGNGQALGLIGKDNAIKYLYSGDVYPGVDRGGLLIPSSKGGAVGASGSESIYRGGTLIGISTNASNSGVVGTVTRTQITVNVFQRTA